MKKIISYLLTLMLVIGICPVIANATTEWDGTAAAEFSAGDGSEATPYEIATASELALARDLINENANGEAAKHYKLTADIDMCNVLWKPIGEKIAFTGTLDGNGHVIRNVYANRTTQDANDGTSVAFIAQLKGTVKNLGLDGVVVYNAASRNSNSTNRVGTVGGFVGICSGTITDCYIKNAIVKQKIRDFSGNGTGVFAGNLGSGATIRNCYVYNAETAGGQDNVTGGFFGVARADEITVENCYTAKVEYNLTNCSNLANISTVYGFGYNPYTYSVITNCYSEMDDSAGTWKPDTLYFMDRSAGVVGATKDAISTIFNTYNSFDVKSNINDGYPCLSWETWTGIVATGFAGGNGEDNTPYEISNVAELLYAQQYINGTEGAEKLHYKLTADIDLRNSKWVPIGNAEKSFEGTFDGNGHVVTNIDLTIKKNETMYKYAGFFGCTGSNAIVKNLGIDNIKVSVNNWSNPRLDALGGMVAYALGRFENCYVKNSTVQQTQTDRAESIGVGGFAGMLKNGVTIKNCYVYNVGVRSGHVRYMGGFFAYTESNGSITLDNCYVAGLYIDREGTSHASQRNDSAVFGFGASESSTISLVNCLSTFADTYANFTSDAAAVTKETVDAYKRGTTGADMRAINKALVTSESEYKTETAINDGYPSLNWEKKPYENEYIVSAFSKQKNTIFILENEKVSDAKVYVVAYNKNGRYIESQVLSPAPQITPTVTGDKIGVFVWDEELRPLAKQYFDLPSMLEYTPGVKEDGLALVTGGPTGDAYAWVGSAPDGTMAATSAGTKGDGTDRSHYIYWSLVGAKDSRRIKWEDNSLTFEITYLDTTGPLGFVYNSIAPEDDKQLWTAARKAVTIANEMGNTKTWKTAVIKVNDAELKNSSGSSSGSFGIVVPSGSYENIYIKSVKVIQSGLYLD